MKKNNWKNKIHYWFDNLMSGGTISLILLLAAITFIVVAISGFFTSLLDGGEHGNIFQSMWLSLMHAIDAGTIAGDDTGNIFFIILMSIVTLCGLFITSMLIGVISTGLEDKMTSLRKGHSLVLERNHVIILGFNENALNIVRELIIANENQKKCSIVILDDKDKTEMEDLINQRIPDTKTTRIICRSGNIDNIADISICSPETCRSIIVNAENDFMSIKAVLASATILENNNNNSAYITALIHSKENVEAARIAGNGRAEIFFYQSSIAKIMAHTCRQPGMSSVFTSLLSYEGNEIYVEHIPSVIGKTLAQANLLFANSVVIGLVSNNKPILNPPANTVINETDKLIIIAEDDGISIPQSKLASIKTEQFAPETNNSSVLQKTLILGCNELVSQIITELDAYVESGSSIVVAAENENNLNQFLPQQGEIKNIKIEAKACDIFDRTILEQITEQKPDNILILTNKDDNDDEADSKTLLLLLQLRDIAHKNNLRFAITSEMRSVENQELAQVTKVTDFVISSNITALMMTQISQTREQFTILEDLLSDEGSELYMKNISRYVKCNEPVNFFTICASANRYNEIPVGYKKIRDNGEFDIVINPQKNQNIIFNNNDSLILIAEN